MIKNLLVKFIASALVFLFIFQPLAPVFAEEINEINVESPTIEDAPIIVEDQTSTTPAENTSENLQIDGIPDSQPSNSPDIGTDIGDISQPADLLPDQEITDKSLDTPLAISQSSDIDKPAPASAYNSPLAQKLPEIDKNTGALNYNFSISVPAGRNNLQPNLALSYNSNLNDQNNIFGYGWTISIPYIQRLNKTGTNALYSSNYFYSSLDGELSNVGGSSYIPRTENGSFNKYTFQNNQWLVIAKDGAQYKFGYGALAQQNDPANPSNVYKWMLQEIRDTNNNFISFSYFKDVGQIYPLAIKYTGAGNTDGIFEINFSTEAKIDKTVSYNTGFLATTNYRINQITASVNGSWVTKYVLSYVANQNTSRSLLTSITASGKDTSGNIITLPATSFSYQFSGPNWSVNSSWDFPNPDDDFNVGNACAGKNLDPIFADLNRDGLTDLITFVASYICDQNYTSQQYPYKKDKVFINTGAGWSAQDYSWKLPDNSSWKLLGTPQYYGLREVHFPDLNSDGFPDLVEKVGADGDIDKTYIYINNGRGWTDAPSVWKLPELPSSIYSEKCYVYSDMLRQENDLQIYFPDLNGDGLADLVQTTKYQCQSSGYYDIYTFEYINNGNGWTGADSSWNLKSIYPWLKEWHSPGDSQINFNFPDLNADGLADIVIERSGKIVRYGERYYDIYINNGRGWTASSLWDFPIPKNINGYSGDAISGIQFSDFNNDGLQDLREIILLNSGSGAMGVIYVNNERGWNNIPLGIDISSNQDERWVLGAPRSMNKVFSSPQFPDLNGDNVQDFVKINIQPQNYGINKDIEYINNGKRQNLLSQIIYPQGGSTTISYKSSAQYTDDSGNPVNKSPYPIFTVSQIANGDGFGNNSNFSYNYQGGNYYYQDPFNKQFSGYNLITQTDGAGNITKTYYHAADSSDFARGEFEDNYFKIGKPYRIENYDSSGKLFQVSVNKWDSYSLASRAGFVKLIQTIKQDFDGQPTHKDKAETFDYDNKTGNQIQKIEWGEVLANNDGSFTDAGNDKYITNITYASSPDSRVIASPSDIMVSDQNNNKSRESKFYYDNLEFGNIGLGNQTAKEDWQKNSDYIKTEKVYNSFGLATQIIDANKNAADFAYDSYNLYPAIITNALSQTVQYAYNYVNGKIIQTIDANGNIFKNTYDGFGRVLKIEQPDENNLTNLVGKTAYVYTDTAGAAAVQQTDYLDSSNSVSKYNYYDGLGRIIQTKKSAENNNFETKDLAYDNRGNFQKESLPYFSSGSAKTAPTAAAQLYAIYAYDALNRKTSATNVVGTTSYAYKNWQTTITDANGNKKDFVYDAQNNLIQVNEYNGADVYSTTYGYNGLGNLIKITDALGNVRNFIYDGLGRKLTAQDLHNPADSVFGAWNYAYDNAGNLISVTDPKNQTINYTYDALNRKISEDYAGKEAVEVVFSYDNCPNGKGRLCKTVSTSGTEQYEYSATGNITKSAKTFDAENLITLYSFDRQGNQILITSPDNLQTKYIYNPAGLLNQTEKRELTDTGFTNLVTNFDYSPIEQITTQAIINGDTIINTYDPAKLYRLANKVTTNAAGTQLQNLTYTYDAVGNITKLIDNSATDSKKTVSYTYDHLYRLLSSTATSAATGQQDYTQSFSYDVLGNILSQTLNEKTTTYDYRGNLNNVGSDYANPDAVTKTIVTGVAPAPVISYFTSSPSVIISGQSAVLSWAVSGGIATSLNIDNNIGSVLGLNFKIVSPTKTTTYILTAVNNGGSTTKLITIIVAKTLGYIIPTNSPKPIIDLFAANPATIAQDQSVILSWILSGGSATTVSINNGVGSVLGLTGKIIIPTATTTYTLTATNSGGSTTKSVTVTVNPPAPIIYSLTANPTRITQGESVVLSWILSGGAPTFLNINNAVGSVLGATSKTVNPTVTTTYTLIAANVLGAVTKSVTVTVIPLAPVISTFTVSPATIMQGQPATFSWTLSGGEPTSLNINYGVGSVLGATSKILTPTDTTTYTLIAKNSGGETMKSATVTVNLPLPVIDSFTADPITITQGQFATLSWSLSGGAPTTLSINNGVGSVLNITSKTVSPIITTTYTLAATNIFASVTKTVTVIVNPPAPVISTFIASSATIIQDQSATLFWTLSSGAGGAPTTLSIDNGVGSVLGASSKNVTPTVSTTYILTAANISGTATKSVTITVNPPAPIIYNFTVNPTSIAQGQSATLSWTLSGGSATSLSIDNNVGSVLGKTSFVVKPTVTTTYVLTATNNSGTVIQPVTIIVASNPLPATIINNYTYDANGNVLGDGVNAYAYDYNNRMISATNIATGNTVAYTYDPAGQRIKMVVQNSDNSSTTTYYPTKYYNISYTTDDKGNKSPAVITKHIFANDINIATIKGSGADAKIYYNHSDLLNSSSLMTDSTGAIVETMDYFPFGGIRLDISAPPAGGAESAVFSEQRKFIGQEFDPETGLNYLNARYYNSTLGRFLSQDPMFWSIDANWLSDPQTQNAYSYARNNPITSSDPSGLLTAWFPGTWTSQGDIKNSTQYNNFINDFKSTFVNIKSGDNFWMPSQTLQDNDKSRQSVAQELVNFLSTYKFAEGETFNVGGHSHGGNEANIFSQIYDGKRIDNLVTLGTPVRFDYMPNYENIGKHYNAYSSLDAVQPSGGTIPTLAFAGAVVGGAAGSLFGPAGTALGGAAGFVAGAKLGWGEAGPAGKKYSGATNINVTREASWLPWETHGSYLSSNVWSKISNIINNQ